MNEFSSAGLSGETPYITHSGFFIFSNIQSELHVSFGFGDPMLPTFYISEDLALQYMVIENKLVLK